MRISVSTTSTIGGSDNLTFSGAVSGSGGITKSGSGTLVLSGNNTFSGPTSIDGGRLQVNGNSGSSAIAVNSGATLTGGGTVGNVVVQ